VPRRDAPVGHEHDPASGEPLQDRRRGFGRRRDRRGERDHHADRHVAADTSLAQVVVEEHRGLARRGRALEGGPAHPDDRLAAAERGEHLAQGFRAGHRIELVAGLGEAGGRSEVVVGAERDHEHVGLVGPRVGRHTAGDGVDRGDRLLPEPYVRDREVGVPEPDGLGGLPAEEHVELREAEHEGVGPVDQRDLDLVAESGRQA
jgi:hypothetical protein